MSVLVLGLGVPELLIILAVVLLLFGGSRLAGIGRSSGRAIREFKEETKDLKAKEAATKQAQADDAKGVTDGRAARDEVADAEIVESKPRPEDLR